MIRNIIFDVGDVLIGYRWEQMLRDHGLTDEELRKTGGRMFGSPRWAELDRGNLTIEEAVTEYGAEFPEYAEHIAWFLRHSELMRVSRPDVWKLIPRLKEKGYHIYLLSNYSEELFNKHTEGASFLKELDGGVISYQVHSLKPERTIYQELFNRYGLLPEECLFFDDREENIKGGEVLGMKGIQVLGEAFLIEKLNEIIENRA